MRFPKRLQETEMRPAASRPCPIHHTAVASCNHRARDDVICQLHRARYKERMKTLTITEGRTNLGYWLRQAVSGHDVGFQIDGHVVALRPVEVHSADYALREYGLTPAEMVRAEKRIRGEIKTARKKGETTVFTGGKNDFR